jgi:hypothetical protein
MKKKALIQLGFVLAIVSFSLFLVTIVRRGNPPRTGIQMWYGPHPDIKSVNDTWLVVDVEKDSLTLEFNLYFKNRKGNYSFWFLLPYETDMVDPRFPGATTKQEADASGCLSKKVILRGEYSVAHVFYVPNSTSYRYGTEHVASIQIDFHVRNLSVISEIGQHTLVLTFFGSRPLDLFIPSESQLILDLAADSIPWDNVETMLYVKLPKGSYIRGESIPPITRYYFAESRAAMWLLDFQSPRVWLRNVAITVQCSYSSDSELLLKGILPAIASALMAAGVGVLVGVMRQSSEEYENDSSSERSPVPRYFPILVSLICGSLIILHLIYPNVSIDNVTIALVVILIFPWLFPHVRTMKFPGGTEITFRDAQRMEDLAKQSKISIGLPTEVERIPTRWDLLRYDPTLALASLRIDIEKSLKEVAGRRGIDARGSLRSVLDLLHSREVIGNREFEILREISSVGNRAVHGERVNGSTASRILDIGEAVLRYLDSLKTG